MIVLDSSFLIAFHNERDAHHESAKLLMNRFLAKEWGQGLLLEYVFLEVVTVLLMRRDLATAMRLGRILLDAQEVDFLPSSDSFLETWDAFSAQSGTRLSFADAAIIGAARRYADGLVLTFDGEFRKMAGVTVPSASL